MGIGTTRSLQAAGHYVIGTDCSEEGRLLSVADETLPLPRVVPGEHNFDYSKALFRLCLERKPDLVHAQTDVEVCELGKIRHGVPRYMLPSQDTILCCQDKWRSFNRWQGKVPVPDTYLVRGRESIFNFLQKYGEGWLRLTHGGGGAGSIRVDNLEFAREWVNRHDGWGKFTIAQVLSPETVTWQSLWRKGELLACQQRKRLSWANARNSPSGVSGSTGVGETCYEQSVHSTACEAVLAIDPKPHGLFGVDMAFDSDDAPNPTEINVGRFFSTIDFFTKAGFNFPAYYVRAALGEYMTTAINPLPSGRRWIRCMDVEPVLV